VISLNIVLAILAVHFVADFILQSDWMAQGKSKKMLPLTVHIGIYTACLMVIDWRWALLNGLVHMVVDFFTSRASSYFWAKGERHNSFAVIGFDQLIHYACMFSSYAYLKGSL